MSNKYIETSKVKLSTRNKNNKTILDDVYFTSPFKITHPFYINDNFIKVILMSSSAGTLEGDIHEYEISIGDNTTMELTSQSYEKIFVMKDEEAYRDCDIDIGSNALLRYNLLPTIPYKDSAFNSKTKIKLKDNTSKLIYTDIINCGRVGSGERFEYRYYKSCIEVEREDNNKIIYYDNTIYKPDEMDMNSFGMYEGYTHFANMILINVNNDKNILDEIREIINKSSLEAGASLTENNDISVKAFAYNSDRLIKLSNKISELIIKR